MNIPTLGGIGVLAGSLIVAGALTLHSVKKDASPASTLTVPYVSQAPDGEWVLPWSQACEEASIAMIAGYYQEKPVIDPKESKQIMQTMIEWENQALKKNEDTTAEETLEIIQQQGIFEGSVKRHPRLEDIKNELAKKQPVIAFVDMYQLYQESRQKDAFHVFVINGYDDKKQEFVIQDPAREKKRYAYDVLMNALHDYDPTTKEATGEPTVIFTKAK